MSFSNEATGPHSSPGSPLDIFTSFSIFNFSDQSFKAHSVIDFSVVLFF